MGRMDEWQREAADAVRREIWSLRGPNQIVKVVKAGADTHAIGGYITLGKFLVNKTPLQIGAALGLERGTLNHGAIIYRLKRLPQTSEYDYDLTAQFPGGLAFHPAYSNLNYLPGSPIIHQWRLKEGVRIPVDSTNYLNLKPGQPFPSGWLLRAHP